MSIYVRELTLIEKMNRWVEDAEINKNEYADSKREYAIKEAIETGYILGMEQAIEIIENADVKKLNNNYDSSESILSEVLVS